jgi:hypothetical protein
MKGLEVRRAECGMKVKTFPIEARRVSNVTTIREANASYVALTRGGLGKPTSFGTVQIGGTRDAFGCSVDCPNG